MRLAMLGLLTGMVAWAGSCVPPLETKTGEVEVLALARVGGDALPNVQIEVDGSRTPMRSPLRLAYGTHRLRIWVAGFAHVDREIVLRQSRLAVRVALELGTIYDTCDDTAAAVGGQVTGADGELWVKAVPVIGTGAMETRVEGGYFLLEGLDAADHILLVLRGSTVLHQQVVRPSPKQTNVRIDLR